MKRIVTCAFILCLFASSATVSCATNNIPKAPTGVSAERQSTSAVKLSWKKANSAQGYYIYRYIPSKKRYQKVGTVKKASTTSWTNKKLKSGKSYYFKIKSYNKNKKCSKYSKRVSAKTFKHAYGVFIGLNRDKIKKVQEYKTVVIDADYFTAADIKGLHKKNHIVYTYLNVGSIEDFRSYYNDYKDLTLGPYENWEGEEWIDVSSPKWQQFVIENRAGSYIKKGVDGMFIDNCDVYYQYPKEEIYQGLVTILKELRKKNLKVLINGGDYFVKEYIQRNGKPADILTGVNQETVYTSIDFTLGNFGKAEKETTDYYVDYLKTVQNKGGGIYLLEYTKDQSLAKKVKKACKTHNWNYYISNTLELN